MLLCIAGNYLLRMNKFICTRRTIHREIGRALVFSANHSTLPDGRMRRVVFIPFLLKSQHDDCPCKDDHHRNNNEHFHFRELTLGNQIANIPLIWHLTSCKLHNILISGLSWLK